MKINLKTNRVVFGFLVAVMLIGLGVVVHSWGALAAESTMDFSGIVEPSIDVPSVVPPALTIDDVSDIDSSLDAGAE